MSEAEGHTQDHNSEGFATEMTLERALGELGGFEPQLGEESPVASEEEIDTAEHVVE